MSTLPNATVSPPLSVSTPRVALADRVARAFPPLAVVRGFRYFFRNKVALVVVSEAAIDADVKGKRMQKVRLRATQGRLSTACTCCAKLLGPAACRHVWATLLEIDRQGVFESLRTTQRVLALAALDVASPAAACKNEVASKGRRRNP